MEEKKFRIALLGLGSVGSKVAEILYKQKDKIRQSSGYSVELVYGYVRSVNHPEKQQLAQEYGFQLTDSIDDILQDQSIDVVIELLGRVNPAKSYIEQALKAKKSVITANKDIIAQYGYELNQLAIDSGVWLVYEASVAGGIPIVDTLETHFAFDEVQEITGIMNGTTNYILTKMYEERMSYEEALHQAQALGFAESDPTNDVEGIDAAYKVMVLAQLAFQTYIKIEDVQIAGITQITFAHLQQATAQNYQIKLLGQLKKIHEGFQFKVAPFLVPMTNLLANVSNETNALAIKSQEIGSTFISGPGAGPSPTATSVLADVFRLLITKENMKILARDTQNNRQQTTEILQNSFVLVDEDAIKNCYGISLVFHSEVSKERYLSTQKQPKEEQSLSQVTRIDQEQAWIETTEMTETELAGYLAELKSMGEICSVYPILT